MATERSFYSDDKGVNITGTRAIFGSTTYSMANISSVKTAVEPVKRSPGIITAIIGIVLLIIGIASGWTWLIVGGVIVLAIGAFIAWAASAKYHVRISSASGEATALSSKDKEYVDKIVQALNESMISRG
jgi:hypothetical protein